MKCPKCRSEVGSQPVCPYCGGTIYLQANTTWTPGPYDRQMSQPTEQRPQNRSGQNRREFERRLRELDTKLSLILVLQCGSFALVVLALVILALK